MKKTLYFLCLLGFILSTGSLKAQTLNFTVSPQNQCYSVGTNTAWAYVTTGSPGASSYSWSITSPSTCVGSVSTFSNGMIASISYPCCGVYTITCYALSASLTVINSSSQTATVTCPSPISITSSPNQAVCAGTGVLLLSFGANTYTWMPGNITGDSLYVIPSSSTCYTVYGSSGSGCISSAVKCVTITPPPTLAVTGNTSVCFGNSTTLTASGASSYTWYTSNGTFTSSSVVLTPTATTCYSLIGASANGCMAYGGGCVTVGSGSTSVSISGNTSICSGSSATLTASGASTYTWLTSMGTFTGSTVVLTPSVSTCFSVVGSSGCGTAYGSACINVQSSPSVSISGPSSICAGSYTYLTASGASSYTWLPGGSTATSIIVSPSVSTCYTLMGFGCSGMGYAVKCLTVNAPPVLSVSGNTSICSGQSSTLTLSGASSYTWYAGNIASPSIVVTPSASTCYSAYGLSSNGCYGYASICVNVGSSSTINISGASSICSGSSATLVASGQTSYTWQPGGLTGSVVVVSPTVNTCYTLTGSNGSGCSGYGFTCVNVLPISNASITPWNASICSGSYTTLYASGASNYTWYPGGSNSTSIIVTPTANTCYTLVGSGCSGLSYAIQCITVSPSPVVSVSGNTSVCAGSSTTLSASGANTYYWLTPSGISYGSSIAITPTANGCYAVFGQNSFGCDDSTSICVNIQGGNLSVSGSTALCAGASTTLSASGAQSYTWLPGNQTGNSIVVSPSVSTCYTVIGTTANGCTGSGLKCITVNPKPTITTFGTPGSSCAGSSYTLSASGATSYTWAPFNLTGATIVITPTASMCYTVIGMNSSYCTNTATSCFSVLPSSSISILGNNITCAGAPTTLTATGAQSYTWFPSNTVGSTLSVSPSVASCYTVIGTNANGCISSAVKCMSVQTGPTITASGITSLCAGSTTTLFANGAQSYTWLPGNLTGAVVAVTPSASTCYTVVGTNVNGCVGLSSICVQILPKPIITSSGGFFCSGNPGTLSSQGANTYTWLPGNLTGSVVVVTPSISGCYTVIGTNASGCTNSALSCFSVVPSPDITVSGYNAMCAGNTATLSASGASSYTWSPVGITGANIVVSPSVSTCYTVTGSNNNGCISKTVKCITIYANPVINVSGNAVMCAGSSANLLVSGANTYTWSNGSNSPLITISPSVSTCYTVMGSSAQGCLGSAVKCVSVAPSPSVNISGNTTICYGSAVTLVASGANSYSWNTGSTASVIVVSPAVNTVYSVAGSNGICSNTKTVSVTVNPRPSINIFNSDSTLCPGNTTTLTATGAVSYSWSNGGSGANIVISPSVTTTYTVSGTGANGCSNSNVIVVYVMNCTGIDQHTTSVEISMYPNPSSGHIVLQGNGVNKINFKVYDLLGRELMNGSFTDSKTLDLSSYSNGTYIVRFESGSVTSHQKVILEK